MTALMASTNGVQCVCMCKWVTMLICQVESWLRKYVSNVINDSINESINDSINNSININFINDSINVNLHSCCY